MISKVIYINRDDVLKRAANILNKKSETVKASGDIDTASQMQPDGQAQDNRITDDAFKRAMRCAIRRMAAYIDDTEPDSGITLTPDYVELGNGDYSFTLYIYTDGAWNLSASEDGTIPIGQIFAIRLLFPDTWLDVGLLQETTDAFVCHKVIAEYLENVSEKMAAFHASKANELSQEIKNTCEMRKKNTKYNSYYPWEH